MEKEREVRQGAVKIKSLIKNINAQIDRGTFGFVQVLITKLIMRLRLNQKA